MPTCGHTHPHLQALTPRLPILAHTPTCFHTCPHLGIHDFTPRCLNISMLKRVYTRLHNHNTWMTRYLHSPPRANAPTSTPYFHTFISPYQRVGIHAYTPYTPACLHLTRRCTCLHSARLHTSSLHATTLHTSTLSYLYAHAWVYTPARFPYLHVSKLPRTLHTLMRTPGYTRLYAYVPARLYTSMPPCSHMCIDASTHLHGYRSVLSSGKFANANISFRKHFKGLETFI